MRAYSQRGGGICCYTAVYGSRPERRDPVVVFERNRSLASTGGKSRGESHTLPISRWIERRGQYNVRRRNHRLYLGEQNGRSDTQRNRPRHKQQERGADSLDNMGREKAGHQPTKNAHEQRSSPVHGFKFSFRYFDSWYQRASAVIGETDDPIVN